MSALEVIAAGTMHAIGLALPLLPFALVTALVVRPWRWV